MDAARHSLVFHTNVHCLTKINITERVFEHRDELKLSLEIQGNIEFLAWLNDEKSFVSLPIYYIYEQLNKLNAHMQRWNTSIMKFANTLMAFMSKLENFKRMITRKNVQCLKN